MSARERKAGRVSLAEIFGKKGGELDGAPLSMDDMKELLGDNMPKVSFTQAGRLRMVRALQQRFGDNFKNIPGVNAFLKDFDDESKHKMRVAKIKLMRQDAERGSNA